MTKHFEMSNFDQNRVSTCYLLKGTMNSIEALCIVSFMEK